MTGELWCWGLNDYGQLGSGDLTPTRMPRRIGAESDWGLVSGGFEHTCGLRRDGGLWCWGNNAVGQLGVPGLEPRRAPTRVPLPGAVERLVTGQGHSCAVDVAGALRCWGDNTSGQAGADDRSAVRPSPGEVCGAQ
jgi:alpha-tubulin suppressor-like RCC1 family protein